jgi:hypothetical protein
LTSSNGSFAPRNTTFDANGLDPTPVINAVFNDRAMVVHLPKLDAHHSCRRGINNFVCSLSVLLTLTLALVYLTVQFQHLPRALGLLPRPNS